MSFFVQPWLSFFSLYLNCYCIELLLFRTVTVLNCYYFEPLLSWTDTVLNCYCFCFWTVTVFRGRIPPLLRFLTISRVLELHFKWGWSRWKAKTRGYNVRGRRTQFCPQDSQNCSSTNQSYYPTESVMTQSWLVTHNWSSTALNWARPIPLNS